MSSFLLFHLEGEQDNRKILLKICAFPFVPEAIIKDLLLNLISGKQNKTRKKPKTCSSVFPLGLQIPYQPANLTWGASC